MFIIEETRALLQPGLRVSLFFDMQYTNITIEILQKYSLSKRTKELLAVAIWIKMQHSNSVMWNVTEYKLRKRLHIGKAKAERIIRDMKESDLFTVEGNKVTVASFRDKQDKWTRKGMVYHGAMVCRFPHQEYRLNELYNLINEKLFEYQICAAEHKDCCLNEQKPSGAKGKAITIKQFKQALNMGAASVVRIKKRLIADGKVNSSIAEMHSFDLRNDEEQKRTLQRTGKRKADFVVGLLGFVVLPCLYSVADRSVTDSFRHLIYGRQNKVVASQSTTVASLPDFFV